MADLEEHAQEFIHREGFTYSILDGDEVIGCVCIYPHRSAHHDASVRSWVRESRPGMDVVVWRSLSARLAGSWPFGSPDHASRG